jgi:hypothetical protein
VLTGSHRMANTTDDARGNGLGNISFVLDGQNFRKECFFVRGEGKGMVVTMVLPSLSVSQV